MRNLWASSGKIIPGLKSQVFFCDLDSTEGRAAVGMFRCNKSEAEAFVSLIEWFVHCGVHPNTIKVITPYKVQ